MCMGASPICMSVFCVHAWPLQRSEEVIGSPGIWVKDTCELPHECWKSNLDSLEDQRVSNPLAISPSLDINS